MPLFVPASDPGVRPTHVSDLPDFAQKVDEKKKRFFYSGMDPQARKLFDSKRLRYGFYRELSDAQEREIFKRVQLGKALDKGGESATSCWLRHAQTDERCTQRS